MRTLVIAGEYPWPTTTGSRLRLAMVVRGLRRCGPTELFSVISRFREDVDPPDEELGLDRVGRVGFDNRTPSGLALVPTLVRPGMPLGLPWHDRAVVQRALVRFMSGRYDLVWFYRPRPWVLAGEPVFAPTVLDLDDLEDEKIRTRMDAPRPAPAGAWDRLRRIGADLVSEEEIRRWRRLHRHAGGAGDAVVLCSALDARRATAAGVGRVRVIANGYPVVTDPVGRSTVGSPPTVMFQGLLTYPANIDAARWLVTEVGPALRERVPDVEIRLVGPAPPSLDELDDPPRVTVTGRVPDMAAELARADLVVVPIRYGSGTRLKILEAFAYGTPVVATALGIEGIAAEDGTHALVADDAEAIADACRTLATDPTGARARYLREGAHWITFTSASTVANWRALQLQPAEALPSPKPVSIGPVTTAELERLNYQGVTEAPAATIDSLIETICRLAIE